MVLVGLIWLIGVWGLLVMGLGFAMTVPLMRRRMPDDLDYPHNHGMPGEEVTRITSYNVCYTKLLRPRRHAITMPSTLNSNSGAK